MNIEDGNIFEAMRLVLPEHRELMRYLEELRKSRQRPELTEDEMAEFEYLWGEAWNEQYALAVTLFHSGHEQIICGIPLTCKQPLRLQTERGCIMIPQEDIIRIKRV